jgi:putative lipoprotein
MNPKTLEIKKQKYKDCISVDIKQMDRNEGDQPVIGLKQVIWDKNKGLLQYSLKNGISYTFKE